MTQLRPISLCNTVYKVISKIIVRRLRNLLPKLISPIQVAFVPGLGSDLVELIMWSITSVQHKVVLNGEELNSSRWKCIKVSRGGPSISHLFFADDLILFGDASLTQVGIMKECLDVLCSLSGHQVSFSKSRVFCSNNIIEGVARNIAIACGSPLTKNLGKYMGVPLIHGRITNHTYNESVKLPSEVCRRLDKINKDFLLGHTNERNHVHLITWNSVCLPKWSGDLGIKTMKDMNQAFLAKAAWRVFQDDGGIWCKILKYKYLNTKSLSDHELSKWVVCSSTWRAIYFGVDLLHKGLRWRVGSGEKIRFWVDDWVPDIGVLKDLALVDLSVVCLASYSVKVWDSILKDVISSEFYAGGTVEWMRINLTNDRLVYGKIPCWLLFAIVIWFIWKWRCRLVFDPEFITPRLPHLIIIQFCLDWLGTISVANGKQGSFRLISWIPPLEGWVKLNVDGSCDNNLDVITSGGVLRDHLKNWLTGFVLNKGRGNVLEAELWGFFEGLMLAWRSGYRNVLVETDSLYMVQLLAKDIHVNHPMFSIAHGCSALINLDWHCLVSYVYWERNKMADGMARLRHGMKPGLQIFKAPLLDVWLIFQDDWKRVCLFQILSFPPFSLVCFLD
ncbi:hypothetical protein Dsin_022276 [Dipteronia sinensis]|uniref:RNase H type-1 domain-containing protein n=1 Tax=Dipteronia sinensis TaxID=43782 RepID=A0AAE0A2P3_9ROSI|nr:hypothetical protein Dsin_022276 [Dipteronia sinensis]